MDRIRQPRCYGYQVTYWLRAPNPQFDSGHMRASDTKGTLNLDPMKEKEEGVDTGGKNSLVTSATPFHWEENRYQNHG